MKIFSIGDFNKYPVFSHTTPALAALFPDFESNLHTNLKSGLNVAIKQTEELPPPRQLLSSPKRCCDVDLRDLLPVPSPSPLPDVWPHLQSFHRANLAACNYLVTRRGDEYVDFLGLCPEDNAESRRRGPIRFMSAFPDRYMHGADPILKIKPESYVGPRNIALFSTEAYTIRAVGIPASPFKGMTTIEFEAAWPSDEAAEKVATEADLYEMAHYFAMLTPSQIQTKHVDRFQRIFLPLLKKFDRPAQLMCEFAALHYRGVTIAVQGQIVVREPPTLLYKRLPPPLDDEGKHGSTKFMITIAYSRLVGDCCHMLGDQQHVPCVVSFDTGIVMQVVGRTCLLANAVQYRKNGVVLTDNKLGVSLCPIFMDHTQTSSLVFVLYANNLACLVGLEVDVICDTFIKAGADPVHIFSHDRPFDEGIRMPKPSVHMLWGLMAPIVGIPFTYGEPMHVNVVDRVPRYTTVGHITELQQNFRRCALSEFNLVTSMYVNNVHQPLLSDRAFIMLRARVDTALELTGRYEYAKRNTDTHYNLQPDLALAMTLLFPVNRVDPFGVVPTIDELFDFTVPGQCPVIDGLYTADRISRMHDWFEALLDVDLATWRPDDAAIIGLQVNGMTRNSDALNNQIVALRGLLNTLREPNSADDDNADDYFGCPGIFEDD